MNGTARMSIEEWKRHERGRQQVRGAIPVIEDGWRFASKLERDRYLYWRNMWALKAVAWFTRQVPFYLPGGIIWRADFVAVWDTHAAARFKGDNEIVTVEDCKGHLTDVSRNKIKQVEAIYGFKVHIIKRGAWK